jgi:hypothetical protein
VATLDGQRIGSGGVGSLTAQLMDAFGPYTAQHGTAF